MIHPSQMVDLPHCHPSHIVAIRKPPEGSSHMLSDCSLALYPPASMPSSLAKSSPFTLSNPHHLPSYIIALNRHCMSGISELVSWDSPMNGIFRIGIIRIGVIRIGIMGFSHEWDLPSRFQPVSLDSDFHHPLHRNSQTTRAFFPYAV
jgi:hypothetical protein